MSQERETISYQTAAAVGNNIEKTTAFVLDQLENFSLKLMEEAAAAFPENEGVRFVGRTIRQARRVTVPIPDLIGHLAAGTTFLSLRLGVETIGSIKNVWRDTTAFMSNDVTIQEK
jgi:hypothetical protein